MKKVISKKFKIMELTNDGLLKEPVDSWGDRRFNHYGYDSMEEAEQEIIRRGCYYEFVIVPFVRIIDVHEYSN